MNNLSTFLFFLFLSTLNFAQELTSPCSHESIMHRHLETDPNAILEWEETELEIAEFIEKQKVHAISRNEKYIIPVVMHVFHWGENGKMGMDQALSGLEILNNEFKGLNEGWNSIVEEFDTIKASMDIEFCLAKIDPDGNPTTGLMYYEDVAKLNNNGNLFAHAWDNRKYLNIYFPKYTEGGPSVFTAYAYYPNDANTANNTDGIFYSSVRWGYGTHSVLNEGDNWASVCTHEVGHWLGLRHTFEGGCGSSGDNIDDTPPTLGGTIQLAGCNNNDFSCDVSTNGSNYMDYNHRCKKMFTRGQVERMTAALSLWSRENLWSEENLESTGCSEGMVKTKDIAQSLIKVYPNPASNYLTVESEFEIGQIEIRNLYGKLLLVEQLKVKQQEISIENLVDGVYYYTITARGKRSNGNFVVANF